MSTYPPPELYIPVPAVRPGEKPDFSHLSIPPAGAIQRPLADAPESELRDLPYGMIRTLDDEGRAVGAWLPSLSVEKLVAGLRAMIVTRTIDDRMYRAHRQGKIVFYSTSSGEEAIGVAQSLVLGERDMCFPTYRVQGWLMARGYPLDILFNQIYSNEKDPLLGRQMNILYSARDYGFYSLSGNLGSRFGHAVGWAMAAAYSGDPSIAIGYVGEGTTAEGAFHEALTFASVYHAPVILCVTNNQWAISSFSGIAGAHEATFAAKSVGYGIPGLRADGNDFLAIAAVTEWAVERARLGLGPTLIELFTYRAGGHSTSDDPSKYRPADEAKAWPLGDPIDRLKKHLTLIGAWSEDKHAALTAEVNAEVRDAMREAEAIGTFGKSKPSLRWMFEGVFKEPDWRLIEQRREIGV